MAACVVFAKLVVNAVIEDESIEEEREPTVRLPN